MVSLTNLISQPSWTSFPTGFHLSAMMLLTPTDQYGMTEWQDCGINFYLHLYMSACFVAIFIGYFAVISLQLSLLLDVYIAIVNVTWVIQ
jgi:hypothetical protein